MPKGHAVVDGSNIATEGRNEPSLAQLREAVAEFEAENDFKFVTVVVDASFEHRVSAREKKAARTAVDNGELITPPAGVVGRGDTFILEVADRATAVVLSNDSFQEFHGTYDWLFDEGRLIGGKPVPGVGWIYVPRTPVRGPVSRRARKSNSSAKKPAATPSPKRAVRAKKPETSGPRPSIGATKKAPPGPPADVTVDANTKTTWEAFRRDHQVGSKVKATVERFSSHGAYGTSHRAVVYFPNRILGNPAPNRARDAVSIGESRLFIVHRFDEERFGIDLGLLAVTADDHAAGPPPEDGPSGPRRRSRTRSAPAKKTAATTAAKKKATTARTASAKKTTAKGKAPARKSTKKTSAKKATSTRTPAKKTAAKKAATGTPAKKATRTRRR